MTSRAIAFAILLAGCGGAPAARPVESGALVVNPATPAPKPPAPAPPERPADVVAWIHVDDPDAVFDILGGQLLSQNSAWMPSIQPWVELIDTRQPMDFVLLASGDKLKDADVAVRLALRDTRAMIDKLGTELDVKQDGKRVHIKKRRRDEDWIVCDLGATRGPDVAICGTASALERAGDWLETAPLPGPEETARAGKASPIVRAALYGPALSRFIDDGGEKDVDAFLRETKSISAELGRDGTGLAFAITARLATRQSKTATEMFEPVNTDGPNDAFYRVWQDNSAAVFAAGGGALPKWAKLAYDELKDPKQIAAVATLAKAFEKPVVASYGIRADRARTALAAVKSAKDPEKAMRALEKALDAYVVIGASIDIATAQSAVKDLVLAKTAEEKAAATANKKPFTPTYTTRNAPAALGLPKGSFFVDELEVDWRAQLQGTKAKPTTEPMLFFSGGGLTWGVSGPDDAACAETAKKLLATTPPKIEEDALFKRKGVVAAGYASSLVGAFAMHKFSLLPGSGANATQASVLAELEHDLSLKRMPLPFVLTAQRQGDGGIATFEIRGERDAFQMLGEHVGGALGGGLGVLVMMMMMGGFGP